MDMNLSGPQQAQLQAALLNAFPSRFAVEQFMRYALDQNLNALAGDVGLNEVVFRVIEWAKAQGTVTVLLDKARQHNPDNAALKAFAEQTAVAPDPVVVAKGSDRAATAARGLETLEQLMKNPQVREAVGDFQSDFEAAATQIEVLAFYKDMHDLLHTLQFQCYRGITQEAKRFPDDATSREILTDHEITFGTLLAQLEEVAGRGVALDTKLIWLQDLRDAQAEFQKAIQQTAAKSLTRAIWLMERVLAVQPSHINTRLNAAARALRLTALVGALTVLRDQFAGGGLDPAKTQAFTDSIRSMEALQQNLTALVIEHDRWQALDLDLRRIQQNLKQDVLELELSWDRVLIMITPLCSADEPWAVALRGSCDLVGQGIAAQDAVRERQAFQRLYAQAADRFYRVDTTLKKVCESLRSIAEPLTTLLGLMK
jgi:hypothetical protein